MFEKNDILVTDRLPYSCVLSLKLRAFAIYVEKCLYAFKLSE